MIDDELEIFYNQNKKNNTVEVKVQTQIIKKEAKLQNDKNNNSNKKLDTNIQPSKTIPMLSMKAFIFNFKKFYKEKTKIRNLISENSAKQRNISNKIYLRNYFNSYKEIKVMLIQTKIQEARMLQVFEELAFRNVAHQQDTRIYVKNQETDNIAQMCRESLQDLFLQKESAFYEKKIICKFLFTLMQTEQYTPIQYPDLLHKYKDLQAVNSIYLSTVGKFIKDFSKIVQQQQFKLVDVAHFLYEQKYRRQDVDLLMKFMTKVKEYYNQYINKPKTEQIDGDQQLSFEIITNSFTLLNNKDKTDFDLIKDFLSNVRFLINDQIKVDTVERVQKIMELNIIGDFIYKYFIDLDLQISNYLTYIEQISNLLYSIDKLNLSTKQDQLEVLLGYMHKIQNNQIEELTAQIAQKHSKLLTDLINQFEKTLEEAQINKTKKRKQIQNISTVMPHVKQVLYEEDIRDAQSNDFVNPYNPQTSDSHVRKPKILNINQMKPQNINVDPNVFQDAENLINAYVENEYNQDDLFVQQIQEKQKIKSNQKDNFNTQMIERDLLYEREFEKIQKQSKVTNKDDMILQLQNQIKELRQQVEIHKKN